MAVIDVEPGEFGFDGSLELEWILTNGLGGYSSSTVLGCNTRKYHGLLVSSLEGFSRFVCLEKMEDKVESDSKTVSLDCVEFGGGTLVAPGFFSVSSFRRGLDEVCFVYETPEFVLEKTIVVPNLKNAVLISYKISNKTNSELKHTATPHVSWRGIHELLKEGKVEFNVEGSSVSAGNHTLRFNAPGSSLSNERCWMKNIYYRKEAERGYEAVDESFIPFKMYFNIKPGETKSYSIAVSLDCELSSADFAKNPVKRDSSLMDSVLASANSFIVNAGSEKTVIAGYHWFGEWGRDAMISLPGLTLANGKFDDTRMVLEHFLGKVREGRIMTETESGSPVYRDFDSTLWLVDRMKDYLKYVGLKDGKPFLEKHWSSIFHILRYYGSMENDGLIPHSSGTWMDTLNRDSAVEVQALWYNAVKSAVKMSEAFDLELGLDAERWIRRFESHFMAEYWNGSFLRDCGRDDSFRPNQVIALSLDYNCVPREHALSILQKTEELLLTPMGLRTLSPKDVRYKGRYDGGVLERDVAYHNGTVWPWLLGPYVKACVKYRGVKEAERVGKLLEEFFKNAIVANALGSINEIYDGNLPHTPRGCVSQAWSVAEPLRAYYEDALGRKPEHESIFS